MENSFVAFFDVLGFKNMVEKNLHEELIEIYQDYLYQNLNLINESIDPIYKFIIPDSEKASLDIKVFIISDSIILIQNDMSKRGFLNLIGKCQILLSCCMSDGIPLRGALSFGPVSIIENKRGTSIVGYGLTKAYILESKQLWSGGIIDKSCFDLFPDNNSKQLIQSLLENKVNPLIVEYNIPLKENEFMLGYGFNWPQYDLLKNEDQIVESFKMHKKEVNCDKEIIKMQNTIKYFKHCKSLIQK